MESSSIEQPAFGQRLRALRQQRGLSQRDVAGGVVNPSYISLIESGARVPTLDVAVRLAEILGVAVDDLVAGGDTGRPQVPGATPMSPVATRPPASGSGPPPLPGPATPFGPRARGVPALPSDTQRLVHELLAEGARETGDLSDARDRFRVALDASRSQGNAVSAVENGWALLDVLGRIGDLPARLDLSAELVEIAAEIDTAEVSVRTRVDRAAALRDAGELRAARDHIDRALAEVEGTALAHTGEHVRLLGVAVSILSELGDTAEVRPTVTAMLDVAAKVNSDAVLGRALWAAGLAHGHLGDVAAASQCMSRAAHILSNPSTPLRDWIRFSLAAATALLDSDGDIEVARRHLNTAATALSLVDLPGEAATLALQSARVALRGESAADALRRLDALDVDSLPAADVAGFWAVRARALEELQHFDEAAAALRRAAELCENAGAFKLAVEHWRQIDRLRSR